MFEYPEEYGVLDFKVKLIVYIVTYYVLTFTFRRSKLILLQFSMSATSMLHVIILYSTLYLRHSTILPRNSTQVWAGQPLPETMSGKSISDYVISSINMRQSQMPFPMSIAENGTKYSLMLDKKRRTAIRGMLYP